MRFLVCQPGRLTGKSTFSLVERSPQDLPQYAILSHRWGTDEVLYDDIQNGTAKYKRGYKKLKFCAKQGKRDGLTHFWIDTCCIDRSSSAELSEAINSMYRWYENATKCYVYLNDVGNHDAWEGDFERSEWFNRGWTLQELIAPRNIEFFSASGSSLGTKKSLERQISRITGISIETLQGKPLLQTSQQERFSWTAQRHTTLEEDAAYCLLGIFGIHMPLLYGEGQEKALARLRRKIHKASQIKSTATGTHGIAQIGKSTPRTPKYLEQHLVAFHDQNNFGDDTKFESGTSPTSHSKSGSRPIANPRPPVSSTRLVIAIDFGTTYTGVCYSEGPEWDSIQTIRDWPIASSTTNQLKIPSMISYNRNGIADNWGFEPTVDYADSVLEDRFKLYIDPTFDDNTPDRPSYEESKRFYMDYMEFLVRYIDSFFNNRMTDYQMRNTEFLLSIPTSWKTRAVTDDIERLLSHAKFGERNRRFNLYLTEAEAVAVHAAEVLRKGDFLIVVDAGGGTTDINCLEVLSNADRGAKFRALTKAEGINVGSLFIDSAVQHLLSVRLREMGVQGNDAELARLAHVMLEEKPFGPFKQTFSGAQDQLNCKIRFTISVGAAIAGHDRYITITGGDLKDAFDAQILKIIERINLQQASLLQYYSKTADCIVLAGGLGSSAYVLTRLKAQYAQVQVFRVNEPRLAVAKGLVTNRIQELRWSANQWLWNNEGSALNTSVNHVVRPTNELVSKLGIKTHPEISVY